MRRVGSFLLSCLFALVALYAPAAQAVCTPAGSTTVNLSLCKPAQGETGWTTAINGNWDIVDGKFGTGGILGPAVGGTGLSSYAIGDLITATGTTTLSRLADIATGNALLSGGVGTIPLWGKVGLTTHVSGVLPTANGGTGIAYFTATGPTMARVYTFPDQAATILYSGGPLGTPSSGSASNLTSFPTLNQNTTGSAAKWTTARSLAGNSVDGSADVAFSNKFVVQGTTDTGLSGAQFLGALGTGIVKNTTTTGVLSVAIAGDFPTLNQSTTGSAATLTTPRAIYGNNFDGSAALTQVIASTYGGTGNGFTKFSGPNTSEKTFTLPDSSDTIATYAVANTFTANQTISNTAPSLVLTDTTASAKSLTIAVDANVANLRESAGANGSLMVLDLANNMVGIGGTPPTVNQAPLFIQAATNYGLTIGFTAGTANQQRFIFARNTTHIELQAVDDSNAYVRSIATFAHAGRLGIGMAPTVQFELSGSVGQKASGTTWSNPSDARLKDNVRDYTDGLNVIRKIRPIEYDLNGLAGTPKGQHGISVIAQEMLGVMPYTIETYRTKLNPEDEQETDLYRFEASAVTFALVNAVKELADQIDELKARLQ